MIRLIVEEFRKLKQQGEQAIAPLDFAEMTYVLNQQSNSIAVIMQHLAGNMQSRWRNFLTSDGEKEDRDREAEFMLQATSKEELVALWQAGWDELFAALEPLTASDLRRAVYINGKPHTVAQACLRQISHYSRHIGQMVYIAKFIQTEQHSYMYKVEQLT